MALPYPLGDLNSCTGTSRGALNLAKGFAARGHHPRVCAKAWPFQPLHEIAEGVEVDRVRGLVIPGFLNRIFSDRLDISFVAPLVYRNMKQRTEVLMTFNDPWPCIMPRASFKVFSLHISYIRLAKRRLIQKLMNADLTLCCSRFVAERVRIYAPGISRRITYVHNGVDCKPFANADGERIRRRLGISPDEVVLMYAGVINEQKGLAYLIAALRKLHSDYPNISLLVLGSAKLWLAHTRYTSRSQEYERLVRLGASDLPVRFVGVVPEEEKPDYFAASDVFVCPSVWDEAFGLVNLEAMAAGKPVVATRVGGIPEVVRDGETGTLVTPADSVALATAIIGLVKDEDLRIAMGARGREVARTQFTMDRMVDGYLKAIK